MLSMAAVLTNTVIVYLQTKDSTTGTSRLTSIFPLSEVGVVWSFVAVEHAVVVLKMALRVSTAAVPQQVVDDRFREGYYHQKVGAGAGVCGRRMGGNVHVCVTDS